MVNELDIYIQYSAFLHYTSLINAVHLRGCGTTTMTAHVVTVVSFFLYFSVLLFYYYLIIALLMHLLLFSF